MKMLKKIFKKIRCMLFPPHHWAVVDIKLLQDALQSDTLMDKYKEKLLKDRYVDAYCRRCGKKERRDWNVPTEDLVDVLSTGICVDVKDRSQHKD